MEHTSSTVEQPQIEGLITKRGAWPDERGRIFLEVDGRVARVPRASGGERFFRAPTRAVQLFAGPRRTAAFRGEVRRHECVRCAPELIRDAQTNELWARLVDGERFVCVSERAATEGENDATLALEAVEMTGYFCNCYARHYAGELPARTAPRLDAPRAAAVPPWVCFRAAEVRLAPRDDVVGRGRLRGNEV